MNSEQPRTTRTKFTDLLGRIGTAQPAAALLFEQAILKFLEGLAARNGGVVKPAAPDAPWDLEADKGLPGLDGPVVIEVRFLSSCSESNLTSAFSALRSASGNPPPSHLLIIHGRLTRRAEDLLSQLQSEDPTFCIWDHTRLSDLFENNPELADRLAQTSTQSPENVVTALRTRVQSEDWKSRKEQAISSLRQAYQDRRLTLIIGAGISMGARLPSWDQLLNEISGLAVGRSAGISPPAMQPILQRFNELSTNNPIVLARYFKTALAGSEMPALVRNILYRRVLSGEAGTSRALVELAHLCAARRSHAGINSVITYNYDDLIEHHLREDNTLFCVIKNGGYELGSEELPVYHVHGFLPRSGTDDEIGEVVLSEDSYHALYLNPYHWANIVQLNALTQDVCLFVGHSMTDPNLRRLLDAVRRARTESDSEVPPARHCAILKRLSVSDFMARSCRVEGCTGAPRLTSEESDVEKFLVGHHETEEAVYLQLGVRVVWVEEWDDLPGVLESISTRT